MRFNPSDFLRIAKWLIDADVEEREAILRTSIGRAYYTAHLDSRKWLIMHGCQIPKDIDAHKSVITELRRWHSRGVGDMLDYLRKNYRNRADYDLDKTIKRSDAQRAIEISEAIIGSFGLYKG